MRVVVTIDHRFSRTPDGAVWTRTSFTYDFWKRYLSVFDGVCIVARMEDAAVAEDNWTRCDGDGISFTRIPYYVGIIEYLRKAREVRKSVRDALGPEDAVILRIHGQISSCLRPQLRKTGRPYGAEVIGDPYSVLASGQIKHPLRHLLKWWLPRRMREQSAGACAVSYVTRETLQGLYPAKPGAFTTNYSSIVLSEESFVKEPRRYGKSRSPLHLVTVCTLNDLTKGPNILIDAAAKCVREGLDVKLAVVGGGKHQGELMSQAKSLGLGEHVDFLGWLPAGKAVYDQLDMADLFVLPSFQEGVSRSALEAMARGLPCVTSDVGGMPEILPMEDMVPCGDADVLANKILEVAEDPARLNRMASRNLEMARQFGRDILSKRWTAFYQHVRAETERWVTNNRH
jgi:glycosyltransferase involved in cell wall biosynthesis